VNQKLRIGHWLIEPELNSISGSGRSVHLEPKVMEVLLCLAERPGKVVSKQDLISTVWSDAFVTDDVLTRAISELRRVLDDEPKQPQFIETIPKRGYRLIHQVKTFGRAGSNGDEQSRETNVIFSGPLEAPVLVAPRSRRLAWGIAILLAAGILAGALLYVWRDIDPLTSQCDESVTTKTVTRKTALSQRGGGGAWQTDSAWARGRSNPV